MNFYLMPLDTLLAQVRDASSVYLFPTVLGMALLAVLMILVVGQGSELPREAAEAPPAPAAQPVPTLPAVLVVDDSAVARAKLRRLFEGAGYAVEVAHDGLEALDALSQRFFSVLVTDLEMPNMSGTELIASVQGSLETEDLPIIAITGHEELQAHVRDVQGLYGIFRKPWNDRELLKRVESLSVLRQPPAVRVAARAVQASVQIAARAEAPRAVLSRG